MDRRSVPMLEWVLAIGGVVGAALPWFEVGRFGFSGIRMATVDFAAGEIPKELGIPCLVFALALSMSLVLMIRRAAPLARAATDLVALAAFGVTASRLAALTKPGDHVAPPELRAGLHVTGGCVLALLVATTVFAIRAQRSPR